jgi:sulfate permease
VPKGLLTVELVIIILLSATVTLFCSNLMGIPLSTSEVTIGSVVGVGVAYKALFVNHILVIVGFWIGVPLVAFMIAWIAGRLIIKLEKKDKRWRGEIGWWKRGLTLLVIAAGFTEAFSAGMNNVANAVGPLVGANLLDAEKGVFWGGIFVALGAILLGGRVLETNGKKITNMSLLQGTLVSGTGGFLVIVSSIFGIPVPLTQVTTTAILGIGTAEHGLSLLQKGIILKILKVWLVSPVLALVVSYTLVKIFIEPDLYILLVLFALLIATLGLKSLYNMIQEEKRAINEDGGGI